MAIQSAMWAVSSIQLPSTLLNGTVKYLIPGLWDAHVHLIFETDLNDAMFDLLLANGITSVCDTGGQLGKVLAGLTPIQAIEAATINPTIYFNKQKILGSIEAGKLADLVLLNANPISDIRNTQQTDSVIRLGVALNRKRLDSMLTSASE